MFIDFFFELRRRGVGVTLHEWMTLLEGLAKGLHGSSLHGFYHLARALCVKDLALFDAFDEAFLSYFKDVQLESIAICEELLSWLKNPQTRATLSAEQRKMIESLDLNQLRELFEKRLEQQKKRHDGGNKWVGTGGTSPFGHSGYHPGGLRVGGVSGMRSAMQVAAQRRYAEYRRDRVLDVRQIDLALRGLRQLGREGAENEFDLEESIDKTCRNAGELELVFRSPKRNRVKLILLMDVGGSMTPHSHLVEPLFTAASRTGRFAQLSHYYFHNCIYDSVYKDAHFHQALKVTDLIAETNRDFRLVIVGDALMHPAELLATGGSIYYDEQNQTSGINWLRRLNEHFRRAVWLNPEPRHYWPNTTIELVAKMFPMWNLSLDGLAGAVRYLVQGKAKAQPPCRGSSVVK